MGGNQCVLLVQTRPGYPPCQFPWGSNQLLRTPACCTTARYPPCQELHMLGPPWGLVPPLGKYPFWVATASPTCWSVTHVDPYLLFIRGETLAVLSWVWLQPLPMMAMLAAAGSNMATKGSYPREMRYRPLICLNDSSVSLLELYPTMKAVSHFDHGQHWAEAGYHYLGTLIFNLHYN